MNKKDFSKEGCKSQLNNTKSLSICLIIKKSLTVSILQIKFFNILNGLELNYNLNLRYVRIYFDATTFDKIQKDRSAKFVDMISAIGGTLGLFTGFSIISAVEIVYFGMNLIVKIIKKMLNGKSLVVKLTNKIST